MFARAMSRFSANLGFLWADRSLPDAIRSAQVAGFDAVECHWPYGAAAGGVREALEDTGLAMLVLNTRRGDVAAGDNGLAAVPGREREARASIVEAIEFAVAVESSAVHVMAGRASGREAFDNFVDNLGFAAELAGDAGIDVLIESLNPHDAPGYFLGTTDRAIGVIEAVGAPNLKLMFDCYHVGRTEGSVVARLRELKPLIGHIQIAAVPDRGPPDHGRVDYRAVLDELDALGWDRPLGAEYRPEGATEASLGWMSELR